MRRYLCNIYGIVQGVGFRPFIYHLALKNHLKGYVQNCGAYVLIDIEGETFDIKKFILQLIKFPPELARIEKIQCRRKELELYSDFLIIASEESKDKKIFISSDIAICEECIQDINNPNSRFFNYPFTNCTKCGPRYSIIKKIPYDRMHTTMSSFRKCEECDHDYQDPLNRRFHAEPVCCEKCGPKLSLYNQNYEEVHSESIIKTVSELINNGKIIAIKGIGGFHLCCDAKNDSAVKRLRILKQRDDKAFAVMARNLDFIKEVSYVNNLEEKTLMGKAKPIVLLYKKKDILSKYIAPNNKYLGMFLPYSPLLYLLFQNLDYCVMTSGNTSDLPITYENQDAYDKLKDIADYFLMNNRDIYMPQDDSVVQVVNNELMVIRLGRGYSPLTIKMNSSQELLALGAEQKSSIAFSQNDYFYLGQYLGDLKNYETYLFFQNCLNKNLDFFNLNPEVLITDYNDAYLSSVYAKTKNLPIKKVYHHYAHFLSCMAEHHLENRVIGIIFDGNGLGSDNQSWGGEFLVGNKCQYQRVGKFKNIRIQGFDSAAHSIWKIGYSYLYSFGLEEQFHKQDNLTAIVKRALNENINCYETSSVGRLFDAIASIINLRDIVTYEGQAALELESITNDPSNDYPYYIKSNDDTFEVDFKEMIVEILEDISNKTPKSYISTSFHNTIVNIILDGAMFIKNKTSINQVCLSGGVFQNRYLLESSINKLEAKGFIVYFNKLIPINDNGIACGQLYYEDEGKDKI